jgi:hypothetical protein
MWRKAHRRDPANSGPSDHASTEDDIFARFPVSGHWIDGTCFSRLIGSNAAGAVTDSLKTRWSEGQLYERYPTFPTAFLAPVVGLLRTTDR